MNQEIISNYKLYIKVLNGTKDISTGNIELGPDKNHATSLAADVSVSHESVEDIRLIIEKSLHEGLKYGFKLRCSDIAKRPFFRFDSAGKSHFNKNPNNPLGLVKVDTPHFHHFDHDGYDTAYKTKELKEDEIKKRVLSDINEGMSLFCRESNCICADGTFPKIAEDKQRKLDFEANDPLNGVEFL